MSTTNHQPRFVVRDIDPDGGPKRRTPDFFVYDTVTQRSYDPCFTRRAAQESADRRNRNAEVSR